jgi:16S rRNA (adenine1518-N6/adenine1519-N6)-dimethyltransferase
LKKRFGQHFLTNRSILNRIVQLAHITPQDTVLEIGPGRGTLTAVLAGVARRVIAIEIDRDLIPGLRSTVPSNVEIIEGDAVTIDLPAGPFHIVSNLPYNVAVPLFKRFVEDRNRILAATVMIQKEVADRLIAKPRTKAYGPLSLLIQYYANVTYGFTVPPGAFTPPPKVDSAVVRLDWKPGVPYAKAFTDFVHQAFTSRRKTLANNFVSMFGFLSRDEILHRLEQAGIRANARPEELSVDEFLRVYNLLR